MAAGTTASTNLLDPLKVLWRRRWVIIACVIVAVVGMAAVDSVRTPVYRAQGAIQFTDKAALAGRGIATDAFLINSSAVSAAASKAIGQRAPKVQVTLNTGTTVANVYALASNPVLAARIVNAYIQGYIQVQSDKAQYYQLTLEQSLRKRIDTLSTQIDGYSYQIASQPKGSAQQQTTQGLLGVAVNKRTALQAQLYALQTQSPTSAAVQVANSLPPGSPISPKPTSDILLAGLVGLAAGIALALLQEAIDDKIRTRADLERSTPGVPALGLIPAINEWTDRRVPLLIAAEQPKGPAAEAFRSIRTSIQFMAIDDPIKTLLVTSGNATDGKTTISCNLAYTMAAAGQDVVIVGCDLRKPRLHEFFGVSNDVGFTSVLLGEAELDDALQDVPGSPHLRILPAGPIPPNPSELLAGRRAGTIMQALAQRCDLIVLDSPPLLPVSDSAVLAGSADAVILVAAAGISTKRDTARSLSLLQQVGASIRGTILNRAPAAETYSYYRYGYGYGYGSGYGYGYGYGYGSSSRSKPAEGTAATDADTAPAAEGAVVSTATITGKPPTPGPAAPSSGRNRFGRSSKRRGGPDSPPTTSTN